MVSWDDVKSRISWAGKASVVKTRTLAKIATVNGKISDAKKNINKGCRELGRILVDSGYADDTAEDIKKRIDEADTTAEDRELLEAVLIVKRYEEELDALIYEKGQLQGITPCRVCGSEVTADSDYCSKCGASVVPQDLVLDEEPDDGGDAESEDGAEETSEEEPSEKESANEESDDEESDDEESTGSDDEDSDSLE